MGKLFEPYFLGPLSLANRFFFPPIKLGRGSLDGKVTPPQLRFYQQIAVAGPAVVILEPVSVTQDGREHPRQPVIHLRDSALELGKITRVIHEEGRLACLHLNHAGAAANPRASGDRPRAPSAMTCTRSGEDALPLNGAEIEKIVAGYEIAAMKAVEAGFDLLEIQCGHGYLISQFLSDKTNNRVDHYGKDRLLFAREVLYSIKRGAPDHPFIVRISGSEMSPDFEIGKSDLLALIELAEEVGASAVHVGMGHSCFSPPWYFHHGSLPLEPQLEALAWVREHTALPVIVAGRMGRKERVEEILDKGLADLFALGRPLIADPGLLEKWRAGEDEQVLSCGYCLQGCLHRMKNGEPLGCNLNPELGLAELEPSERPLKVLVAGGGPAGMSAALYLTRRGHRVTLAEKSNRLGGQFLLASLAPGKQSMHDGLSGLVRAVEACNTNILLNQDTDPELVDKIKPDFIVWATGARPRRPKIPGLEEQHVITAQEYYANHKELRGPRVLVIGAGRVGLEVAEMLGNDGYEVVATKRSDPIGSMMEMITRKLALGRIGRCKNVRLMPHTTVKAFIGDKVEVEQDSRRSSVEKFQTVILATGMRPASGPPTGISERVPGIEVIGDAEKVLDIFSAVQSGYRLALRY